MPVFEYRCLKCGHKFEELVLDNRLIKCPKCQGEVKKLFSSFSARRKEGESITSNVSCTGCTATSCATCKPS
jgi:putative FmdB family regulatory protein